MPRVSEEHKSEVRNRLIDAAVEVLLSEGPTATSRQVLKRAGLSAGALYHYFGSLDELYAAVAERFTRLDDPLYESIDPIDTDPVSALTRIHVQVMTDLFAPGQHTILGQLRVAAKTNDGIRTAMTHYDELNVERAGGLNEATKDVGLFREDLDSEALVEVITAFFEGFATKDAATGFATSRERVLLMFLEMLDERVLDPSHPATDNLRRQLKELAKP